MTTLRQREGDQQLPVRNGHLGIQTRVLDALEAAQGGLYCGHGARTQQMLAIDIRERRRLGIQRYGTELQPHNGRDAVRDAYEETLDLWMYLVQMVEEQTDTCALVDLEQTLFVVVSLAGSLRQLLYLRERYT